MRTTSMIGTFSFCFLLGAGCTQGSGLVGKTPTDPISDPVERTSPAVPSQMAIAPADGPSYSIGGTVKGLVGTGLVLALDEAERLPVDADGPFVFMTRLPSGKAYRLTIATQPSGPAQTCVITRGRGIILEGPIDNLEVDCGAPAPPPVKTYAIGGVVTGLHGTLSLVDRGSAPLAIVADGNFTFPTARPAGDTYDVRIHAQPDGQHCVVERGVGLVLGRAMHGVVVSCVDASCVNLGWKTGGASWTCPDGFRMPTSDELDRISPCLDPADIGRFSSYADIALSVGGCGCGWNTDYCDEPSIQTLRQGQACGDYAQLHVCVMQ